MRALFFGTPAIAVPSLEALTEVAEVVGVVCQPDRPAGRGLELRAPPVKERAVALGLEVVQPTKIRTPEFATWVREKGADVALVIAYGRILPKDVLEAPRRGCLNLHASLLPKYRGAAPITWAIVRGETETGISLMQMDEGMDTGPVLSRHVVSIGESTTADELAVTLGELAASVVRSDVARAVRADLDPMAQVESEATLAPLLDKTMGRIDWTKSAQQIHDHIRGMTSWPGASTSIGGKTLKVLATRVGAAEGSLGSPGSVLEASGERIAIACGTGSLDLLRAQLEGKKPLGARDLISGRAAQKGQRLGD